MRGHHHFLLHLCRLHFFLHFLLFHLHFLHFLLLSRLLLLHLHSHFVHLVLLPLLLLHLHLLLRHLFLHLIPLLLRHATRLRAARPRQNKQHRQQHDRAAHHRRVEGHEVLHLAQLAHDRRREDHCALTCHHVVAQDLTLDGRAGVGLDVNRRGGSDANDAGRARRRERVPCLVQRRADDGQTQRVAVSDDEIGNDCI